MTKMFKIEDGIPVPNRGFSKRYPFGDLAVGQSFFVPTDEAAKKRVRVASAASMHGKKYNSVFATRVVEGGIRVWRVK